MFAPRGSPFRFVALFSVVSCLVNFQDAYLNSYPNTAFLSFQYYINGTYVNRGVEGGLSETFYTWLWSAILNVWFLGYLLGTFITPFFTDNYGRKNSLIATNVISFLASLLAIASIQFSLPELYIVSRVVTSISMGVAYGGLILFLQEVTPTQFRGMLSFVSESAFLAMTVLGMGFGMDAILGHHLTLLVGVGAIPPALAILMLIPLKETPKYLLINRGDIDAALHSLKFYSGERENNKEALDEMMKECSDAVGLPIMKALMKVFRTAHLRKAFLLGVACLQISVCIWPIIYLSTDILEFHFSATFAQVSSFGFVVANFVASVCGMFAVDRFGRRPMLLAFGLLNTFSLTAYSVFESIGDNFHDNFKYGCVVSLIAFGISYGAALGPISYFITSELVPQRYRSLIQSMVFAVNTFMNFAFSFVTLPLYNWIGAKSFVPLYIVPSVFCLFYIFRALPETKAREIHEIVAALRGEDVQRKQTSTSLGSSTLSIRSYGCATEETDICSIRL